jgi:GDP-4-dehydro-6-deoxy-D-mannose reductase
VKVLITGEHGFVGTWLRRELFAAGHEVRSSPGLDVTDRPALTGRIHDAAPDAVAHLAAISFAPDAAADQQRAFTVNVGGTINLMEALRTLPRPPAVLITGSSEVYGSPSADELPLRESSPLAPRTAYALSKAAQESVGLAYATRAGWPLVVCRAFNHTGPGQREVFVVPALARRVRDVVDGSRREVPAGNLDVRRDFSDVRDVVRAYRLLLEGLADRRIDTGGRVVNVCSGRAVSIRSLLDGICRVAGVEAPVSVDPSLLRPDDPVEIRGDASQLERLTGWRPHIDLSTTLRDVWLGISPPALVHER